MNLIRRLMSGMVLALAINIGSAYANTDNHDVYADDDSVLESYNRAMFSFNNYFNHYVFMPTAQAYRDITTPFVRKRVSNIFDNLQEPVSSGNYLLQAEPKGALISLFRFVINSTLGLLGMFDVAEGWGLSQKTIGFDDTFAKWCIPDGPYIVLPLLGPSTPRSAISMGLNFVFDPVYWGTVNDANIHDKATYSLAIAYGVVVMEQNMDLLKDLERSSVDYYAAMKATYMQNRKNKGCFKNDSSANDYDFDFGIEE